MRDPDGQLIEAGDAARPASEGSRLGLALVVIASAQLMVVLDATIVNVALPHVQRALVFSGSGLEWVVNAYAVTFGGLLLLGGRAGDRLGRRRVFVAGLVLFSAASFLGGFATGPWWLLTARAIQGAGSGPGRRGRRVTGTAGVALLVYGLSKAGAGPDGVAHWGDAVVLAALAAAAVLLLAFVLIEWRSSHPLLPLRVLADRNRSGAYLIALCIGTAMFGLFFFLTLFMQTVLAYSAIRSGLSYLPFTGGIVTGSGLSSRLMARVGARPLILVGAAAAAGGMFWFSRLTEHAGYPGELLGPMLVTSCGLGLLFVPLALVALHNVAEQDAGVAASLLNTGQQVGGAIGLAALGTIAWTTVADTLRSSSAAIAAGRQPPQSPAQLAAHALATGFARGFLAAALIVLLAVLIAAATIRVRRQDLTGTRPAPDHRPASQPATARPHRDRAALAAAARPCRSC
jgi:MFS family permease